jgi:hypothetical protein
MTFLEMQDAVMGRLNLSTPDARTRIQNLLNARYAEVTSSLGLGQTRFGTVSAVTVSGSNQVTVSGVEHIQTVTDAVVLKRPLIEATIPQLREMDPAAEHVGNPTHYAVQTAGAKSIVLRVYPTPDSVQAFAVDALVTGTKMTTPTDAPAFPESYHDILVKGALEDEYRKLDKKNQADTEGAKYERRLGELRYHLAKSGWLVRRATSRESLGGARVWPYSNLS